MSTLIINPPKPVLTKIKSSQDNAPLDRANQVILDTLVKNILLTKYSTI